MKMATLLVVAGIVAIPPATQAAARQVSGHLPAVRLKLNRD